MLGKKMQKEKITAPFRRVRRVLSVTTAPGQPNQNSYQNDGNRGLHGRPAVEAPSRPVLAGPPSQPVPPQRLASQAQRRQPAGAAKAPKAPKAFGSRKRTVSKPPAASGQSLSPPRRESMAAKPHSPQPSYSASSASAAPQPAATRPFPDEAVIAAAAASLRGGYQPPDPTPSLGEVQNSGHPPSAQTGAEAPGKKAAGHHTVAVDAGDEAADLGPSDLELADQLFELSYVIAVKERAWRRISVLAAVFGVVIGWGMASLFGSVFFASPAAYAPDVTAAIPAATETLDRSAGPAVSRGEMTGTGGCTVLSLDRKTGKTTSRDCTAAMPASLQPEK